jgi:hypothetical protein
MIDLALTRSEEDALVDALFSSHRIRIEADVLDSDEKPIGSLTDPSVVLEGSVQIDADQPITRSLSLRLLDPRRKLAFVPNHPSDAAAHAENMIAVRYCVEVEELGEWVEIPVFCGPVSKFDHSGSIVQVEAQGKEALGLDPHQAFNGYTVKKGTRVDDGIRRVLSRIGESRFDLPRLRERLKEDLVVAPTDQPWLMVNGGEDAGKGLIDRTGEHAHHAFYDGRGNLVVRRLRKSRVFTFNGRSLLTNPSLTWDLKVAKNIVRVRGAKPRGAKEAVSATARLGPNHPLSPQALSRRGEPRYMPEIVQADSLRTEAECRRRAEDLLANRSRLALEASFDALPVPMLEELDTVAVDTDAGRFEFPLRSFTIPLTPGAMSFGFTKKVPSKRRLRNKAGRRR